MVNRIVIDVVVILTETYLQTKFLLFSAEYLRTFKISHLTLPVDVAMFQYISEI